MERLQGIKNALPKLGLYGELKEDIYWLIEQAEKLEEIRKAFYDKDTNVVDCYRKQIEIFEGKITPSRRARP